jgi:hypothetical protein
MSDEKDFLSRYVKEIAQQGKNALLNQLTRQWVDESKNQTPHITLRGLKIQLYSIRRILLAQSNYFGR